MRLAITSIVFLIITVSIQVLIPADMFFGGKIDFALIIVVYLSLVAGNVYTLIFAFLSGLLVDSFGSHYFASTALAYVIISYVISLFHKKLEFNNVSSMFIFPLLASLGKSFIILIIILISQIFENNPNINIDKYILS
ncbi:MAG: rod shape-determining protein MreD, partial [Spirochaetota bacterium]